MEDDNIKKEESDASKDNMIASSSSTAVSGGTNENFVVIDMAGDSEDSERDDRALNVKKEIEETKMETEEDNRVSPPETSKIIPKTTTQRVRKKPKAPVVDVNSLRTRKWQLKVYPLHADDLNLNYVSILCKLASESLLYIPSESRHGKAELYVATQKETAAIIGKLLRMGFHHKLLSIEVVRKDTGGMEDGDEAKKECKAFLMFDRFLSKKIFDAKGEKGSVVEKTVTLNKVPKAATKDFIGALFPFATDIEIIDSDNLDERKAVVTCKTPVTALLVYKSFKRLEINDVHVKLSVSESVKQIVLPPLFFIPPEEQQKEQMPQDAGNQLNQGSLPPRRPLMTPLNRRVQQIKKRALLTRKRIVRGPLLPQRGGPLMEAGPLREPLVRPGPDRRPLLRRDRSPMDPRNKGPGSRDYPGGPGRRKMAERRERDRSMDRSRRRPGREDSQVTHEMLQLQSQLNQAIKNQIAMLNTTQTGPSTSVKSSTRSNLYSGPVSSSQRSGLLGHSPRNFNSSGGAPRPLDEQYSDSWSNDRGGRLGRDRERPGARPDRDRSRNERPGDRHDRGSRDRAAGDLPPRGSRPNDTYTGDNRRSKLKDRSDTARSAPRNNARGDNGFAQPAPPGGRYDYNQTDRDTEGSSYYRRY